MNTTETKVFITNHNLILDYYWQAFALPLHVGYSFMPVGNQGIPIDVYGGISRGTMVLFKAKNIGNDFDFGKRSLTTLDACINIFPFNLLPNISFGFAFTYNFQ